MPPSKLTHVSESLCFDGKVTKYRHDSSTLGCSMNFNIFLPSTLKEEEGKKYPTLLFLSGLTCTEDNFLVKSGAQRFASKYGMALLCPDTSPRGTGCKDEAVSWEFGLSASYYVDATTEAYKNHYRMYSYITDEFYHLCLDSLPIDPARLSICGHSVGGHGALVIFLRNTELFKCCSVFSPMSRPSECGWGINAFSKLLGEDQTQWSQYDATHLGAMHHGPKVDIFVDQGTKDPYLEEYLLTDQFIKVAQSNPQIQLTYTPRQGFDHGYYYISTFIEEHIIWHAKHLAE